MAPLVPPNPHEVTVIREVVSNVITTISAPFARFGLIKIGGRGTLVRLQNGSVAVFSPMSLTPATKETVDRLGELKYIAAPDIEHHIFLGEWHKAYPNAKVLGPEGLPEKREKQKNENVPFAVVFKAEGKELTKVDAEFDAEFEYEFVEAHPNKELVFFHKPSRTLIEADLLFNLPAHEQYSKSKESPTSGALTKLFSSLQTTEGTAKWQKRLIWYGFSASDRNSFNKSMTRINSWNFDRLIPCHGETIDTGAKGIFEKVMEWHLAGTKKTH